MKKRSNKITKTHRRPAPRTFTDSPRHGQRSYDVPSIDQETGEPFKGKLKLLSNAFHFQFHSSLRSGLSVSFTLGYGWILLILALLGYIPLESLFILT